MFYYLKTRCYGTALVQRRKYTRVTLVVVVCALAQHTIHMSFARVFTKVLTSMYIRFYVTALVKVVTVREQKHEFLFTS